MKNLKRILSRLEYAFPFLIVLIYAALVWNNGRVAMELCSKGSFGMASANLCFAGLFAWILHWRVTDLPKDVQKIYSRRAMQNARRRQQARCECGAEK